MTFVNNPVSTAVGIVVDVAKNVWNVVGMSTKTVSRLVKNVVVVKKIVSNDVTYTEVVDRFVVTNVSRDVRTFVLLYVTVLKIVSYAVVVER